MYRARNFAGKLAALATFLMLGHSAIAADWANNELHLQYGKLDTPSFAGGGDSDTFIVTFQHASGWKYGDNFFFIDISDGEDPGFNDQDYYGEFYTNFSFGKIRGKPVEFGFVKDMGFIVGFNWAGDADVKKYLPGVRFSLDLPGFAFANLDVMAYIDDSEGVRSGGAPKEDDAFLIDFNFAYPFEIGEQKFSIEGHIEYAGERDNEFGQEVEAHILAQPQFRWHPNDTIALGIEYQFWQNKLGDGDTDESAIQALFVWKF